MPRFWRKNLEVQKAMESADIFVDETLHFDEKENELVTTEINDAKIFSEGVSMFTERQEFISCANQEQLLDEESNWKLIAQLELEKRNDSRISAGESDRENNYCLP